MANKLENIKGQELKNEEKSEFVFGKKNYIA